MAGDITTPIEGLSVELQPSPDGESYQFGVRVKGAFIGLSSSKVGYVDDQVRLAQGWRFDVNPDTGEGRWLPPDQPATPTTAPPPPEQTPAEPPPEQTPAE